MFQAKRVGAGMKGQYYLAPETQEALLLVAPDLIRHTVLDHGDQAVTKVLEYQCQADFEEFRQTWDGFQVTENQYLTFHQKVLRKLNLPK